VYTANIAGALRWRFGAMRMRIIPIGGAAGAGEGLFGWAETPGSAPTCKK